MPTRHDSWTDLHAAYHEHPFSREPFAKELAAACLVLRDADWASDIDPFFSHGQLGLSTTSNYQAARQRRAVWLGGNESQRLIATFQERLGSETVKTESMSELSQAALRAVVEWVQGGSR